jgi:hypothetical protein
MSEEVRQKGFGSAAASPRAVTYRESPQRTPTQPTQPTSKGDDLVLSSFFMEDPLVFFTNTLTTMLEFVKNKFKGITGTDIKFNAAIAALKALRNFNKPTALNAWHENMRPYYTDCAECNDKKLQIALQDFSKSLDALKFLNLPGKYKGLKAKSMESEQGKEDLNKIWTWVNALNLICCISQILTAKTKPMLRPLFETLLKDMSQRDNMEASINVKDILKAVTSNPEMISSLSTLLNKKDVDELLEIVPSLLALLRYFHPGMDVSPVYNLLQGNLLGAEQAGEPVMAASELDVWHPKDK